MAEYLNWTIPLIAGRLKVCKRNVVIGSYNEILNTYQHLLPETGFNREHDLHISSKRRIKVWYFWDLEHLPMSMDYDIKHGMVIQSGIFKMTSKKIRHTFRPLVSNALRQYRALRQNLISIRVPLAINSNGQIIFIVLAVFLLLSLLLFMLELLKVWTKMYIILVRKIRNITLEKLSAQGFRCKQFV